MKRFVCLLTVCALALALCACGSFAPRMAVSVQRVAALESLRVEAVTEIEATMSAFGADVPYQLELRLRGDVQREPARGFFELTISSGEEGEKLYFFAQPAEDGTIRVYLSFDGQSWEEYVVEPGELAEAATELATPNPVDFIKLGVGLSQLFEQSGTVTLPDGEGVVYEGVIPGELLQEALRSADDLESLLPSAAAEETLSLVGDVPVRLVIGKADNLPRSAELDLTEALREPCAALLKAYLGGFGMDFGIESLKMALSFSDFNQVSVSVPEI